ncbi:membrane bound O-acyl transferase family-domain-containing protein, partial [Elsinoe ampelina]
IRTYFAVSWIVESLVFLDGANCLLAMAFVSTGIDSPSDWPAIFGRFGEITSLRAFWSRFWHQVSTRTYRSYADWVAREILMLKPTSSRYKTTVAFLIFILSGCCHAAVSWYLGAGMEWLEIWWYLLNFGGCFVEVMAMKIVWNTASKEQNRNRLRGGVETVLGSVWVFLFFFWAVPKWKYPRLLQEAEGRQWLKQALAI